MRSRKVFVTPALFTLLFAATTAALAQGAPSLIWTKGGHLGVLDVALSPDLGTLVSIGQDDQSVKLWSASDGKLLRTLPAQEATGESVAYSPDGQYVASGGDVNFGSGEVNVKLWKVSDGSLVRTFGSTVTDVQTAWSLAFSPDGTILAAARGNNVQLWRVADAVLLRTLTGHSGSVFSVRFSHDGTLIATGSADDTAKIWRTSDGALQRTLTGHTFFVSSAAFSPDGTKLVTGSWDMTAKIWSVSTGTVLKTLSGHTDAINADDWSPDGTVIATASADSTIKLWNATSGALVRTLSDPDVLYPQAVQFASDSLTLVSGGSDSKCRRWRVSDGALTVTFGSHTGGINAVTFASDGRFVSGADDRIAKVWDPNGTLLHDLIGHGDVINAVDVSPDQTKVATAAGSPAPDTLDPTVKIWDFSTGALIRTLPGHSSGSFAAQFSPDGTLLATGGTDVSDGRVKVWRVSDGALLQQFIHPSGVTALRWSLDGAIIVSAAGTTLRWWSYPGGVVLRTATTGGSVNTLSLSPDGATLASSEDTDGNNVRLWRFSDAGLIRTFAGHTDFAQSVAWGRDGQTVVSSSGYDYDIKVWRPSDGALLAAYDSETGWGQRPKLPVALSIDGSRLGYGRNDATVEMSAFAFPPAALLKIDKNVPAGVVHISWTGGIAPYTLKRALDAQFTTGVVTLVNAGSGTSYDDPVLNDGVDYYYRLE
ncbi:MAG TPA: WD40 repeat domain-containing protein [Candidatus Sulfotelmatobacter sp.]|jgi:WD40 repeat protein|nr:WD40 repeat domain-containing protein [Candidatus Sulfotelmatobacter sp.]